MLAQQAGGEGGAPGARGATHPDFAALRRYLVDEAFMDRAGGVRWRAGGTVDVEGPPEQ